MTEFCDLVTGGFLRMQLTRQHGPQVRQLARHSPHVHRGGDN